MNVIKFPQKKRQQGLGSIVLLLFLVLAGIMLGIPDLSAFKVKKEICGRINSVYPMGSPACCNHGLAVPVDHGFLCTAPVALAKLDLIRPVELVELTERSRDDLRVFSVKMDVSDLQDLSLYHIRRIDIQEDGSAIARIRGIKKSSKGKFRFKDAIDPADGLIGIYQVSVYSSKGELLGRSEEAPYSLSSADNELEAETVITGHFTRMLYVANLSLDSFASPDSDTGKRKASRKLSRIYTYLQNLSDFEMAVIHQALIKFQSGTRDQLLRNIKVAINNTKEPGQRAAQKAQEIIDSILAGGEEPEPSATPSLNPTPTPIDSPTPRPTAPPESSPTPQPTATPEISPPPTATPPMTAMPTPNPTAPPFQTPTPLPPTPTPTPLTTPTPTPTATPTPPPATPTPTPTPLPVAYQRLPEVQHVPFHIGSKAMSWDGRIVMNSGSDNQGKPNFAISIFRPEALPAPSDGVPVPKPDFLRPSILGSGATKRTFYDAMRDYSVVDNFHTFWSLGRATTGTPFSPVNYAMVSAGGPGFTSMAIVPDPAFPENPKREGAQDVYHMLVYSTGLVEDPDCSALVSAGQYVLGSVAVTIRVNNPKTVSAVVASSSMTPWTPLRLQTPIFNPANGKYVKYVCGRHPTATFDGRLILFEVGPYFRYSWNKAPKHNDLLNGDWWTQPDDVTRMYSNEKDSLVYDAGTAQMASKFTDRYPIARQPLRDSFGRPFRDTSGRALWNDGTTLISSVADRNKLGLFNTDRFALNGGYPWITPDGTDITLTTTYSWQPGTDPLNTGQDNNTSVRSGMSSIGASTNYTLNHLDIGSNVNRNSYKNLIEVRNAIKNSPAAVNATPQQLSTVVGQALSLSARLVTVSPGVYPSMWGPYAEFSGSKIPYQRSRQVLPIIAYTGQYDEINYAPIMDGNYLLYMRMNEALQRTIGVIPPTAPRLSTLFENLADASNYMKANPTHTARMEMAYRPSLTPDSSANEKSDKTLSYGVLSGGAAFPLEYNARDELVGAAGQAIYFPESGVVTVQNDSQLNSLASRSNELTVQFFFKRLVQLSSASENNPYRYLLNKPGVFNVILEKDGSVQGTVMGLTQNASGGTTPVTYRTGAISTPAVNALNGCTAPCTPEKLKWVSVAMTYNGNTGQMRLLVDGELRFDQTVGKSQIRAGTTPLLIGPGHQGALIAPAKQAIMMLDELSISDKARSAEEIRREGFFYTAPAKAGPPPSGAALPLGLNTADLTPFSVPITKALETLGERIFNDPRFSKNNQVSCATCHIKSLGFADGKTLGVGIQTGTRNTPSIINRAFSTHQFFDGAASSLEVAARNPLLNPLEMGLKDMQEFNTKLSQPGLPPGSTKTYAQLLTEAGYGQAGMPTTKEDFALTAIAAFLRTMTAGNSCVDQYEAGATTKLGAAQLRGRALFKGRARCTACHMGPNFTDEKFHFTGLAANNDPGRGAITKKAVDDKAFKTPTLRDVSKTGPYLHDGSLKTLQEVLIRYNIGPTVPGADPEMRPLGLTTAELSDLEAFLRSLDSNATQACDK